MTASRRHHGWNLPTKAILDECRVEGEGREEGEERGHKVLKKQTFKQLYSGFGADLMDFGLDEISEKELYAESVMFTRNPGEEGDSGLVAIRVRGGLDM